MPMRAACEHLVHAADTVVQVAVGLASHKGRLLLGAAANDPTPMLPMTMRPLARDEAQPATHFSAELLHRCGAAQRGDADAMGAVVVAPAPCQASNQTSQTCFILRKASASIIGSQLTVSDVKLRREGLMSD